jgi:hypothetical protein
MSDSHQSPQQPQKKGFWGHFAQLGPAWIGAIIAVVGLLTGGAVYVVVVHVGTSANATTPPSPAVSRESPTAGPTLPEDASTAGNGTQLGSYSFPLTGAYSAVLGPTEPTQAQIGQGLASYDITYFYGFHPGPGENMWILPNGSTPTYSACATDRIPVGSAPQTQGTAFCILETTGRMAGITVTSMNNSPNYAVLQVTLWQDVQ